MSLIAAVVIGGILLGVYFWNYIVEVFQKHILPWCRENLSPGIAEAMTNMFVWLDKKVTATNRVISETWAAFSRHLYGSETKVARKDATEGVVTRTDYLVTGEGKVKRRIAESTVSWHELPANLREEMLKRGTDQAVMDNKAAIRGKVLERAAEEGMVLELAV